VMMLMSAAVVVICHIGVPFLEAFRLRCDSTPFFPGRQHTRLFRRTASWPKQN